MPYTHDSKNWQLMVVEYSVFVEMDATTGTAGRMEVQIAANCSIPQLKGRIAERKGLAADRQILRHVLKDGQTLADSGIQEGSTIAVTLAPPPPEWDEFAV